MYNLPAAHRRKTWILALGAGLLLAAGYASADGPAKPLEGWLGREFTLDSSTVDDHMPVGGKLTFVFDSSDNVVRVCTRTVATQRGPWRMDFAVPCGVTLTFTAGQRYCTAEDVKAGNAEVLSACHRLRTRDVAMRPSRVRGAVELNDMIVFLVEAPAGKHAIWILVDSPARVTDGGILSGRE
jgi:hypothetical protein